jgi:hypothetical protein
VGRDADGGVGLARELLPGRDRALHRGRLSVGADAVAGGTAGGVGGGEVEYVMVKGTVTICEAIRGIGLIFPRCEFTPTTSAGISKIEVAAERGDEIQITVHFASVSDEDSAVAMAQEVAREILDRLGFHFDIAIHDRQIAVADFAPVNPTPGIIVTKSGALSLVGQDMRFVRGEQPEAILGVLRRRGSPGEDHYGLYRSARLATGPTEEFLSLYHILLLLLGDRQAAVDDFIIQAEPGVPRTPSPKSEMETVYTRLRTEFAHPRPGADLRKTRSDIAVWLGGLRMLTKRAVELHGTAAKGSL